MGAGLSVLPVLLACLLGAIGIVLLALGVRGRRLNDHPICSRCRYDLVGLNPTPALCPECSGELAHPRAVIDGARAKRRGLIALGAIMLLLAVGGGGLLAWGAASRFNWNTIKPEWLLEREALAFGASFDPGVLDELLRRAGQGELGSATHRRVAEHAITLQPDPAAAWAVQYGDLIETAHDAGVLDALALARYFKAGIDVSAEVRERVRVGDACPVVVRVAAPRLGTRNYYIGFSDGSALLNGEPAPDVIGGGMIGISGNSGSGSIASATLIAGAAGPQVLDVSYNALVQLMWDAEPVAIVAQQQRLEFVAVAPDQPLYWFVEDESLRAAMRAAISVRRASLSADGLRLSVDVVLSTLPEAVAFEAMLEADDLRIPLGTLGAAAGAGQHHAGLVAVVPAGFSAERFDLVLVPTQTVTGSALHVERVWGERVVIEDVPITPPAD